MLQVENRTPFTASLAVFSDPRGVETVYLVIKAAFDLGPGLPTPTRKPLPLLAGDVYWGDPASSGIRAAGELTLAKPSTDITVLGHAVAPNQSARAMEVSLRAGPLNSVMRINGRRQWQKSGVGWAPSDPQPFERMPLRWENAYGGFEVAPEGEPPKEFEVRNLAGCGFVGKSERDRDLSGRPLPCIEDPNQLIRSPQDRPIPVGWAPIAPFWSPRRDYAGTYDDAWQTRRAPYLPLDFDPRFFQTAPAVLVTPQPLVGGESVELRGCRPGGEVLAFQLPLCSFNVDFDFRGNTVNRPPMLDAVIIEPDQPRLQLVYRSALAVDKHVLKMRSVRVDCDEYPMPAYLGAAMRSAA
jgi:hypothetical protein